MILNLLLLKLSRVGRNSTLRYLDDLLNINNNFFDNMVNRIYPSEQLHSNKANVPDTEASFLDLHLSILGVLSRLKLG